MSQYGTPRRDAEKDAEQGIVFPPSTRVEARQTTASQKQITSTDLAIPKIADKVGGVLADRVDQKRESDDARRSQEAKARQDTFEAQKKAERQQRRQGVQLEDPNASPQPSLADALKKNSPMGEQVNSAADQVVDDAIEKGVRESINQIDRDNKRAPWAKFVFGEDPGYRAAQQQAVSNRVNDVYLEEAARVSEFAGDHPDKYAGKLREGLTKALEPFAGDVETQALVTAAWSENSTKLAAQHYKEHYGHTQLEARKSYSKSVEQAHDAFTLEMAAANSPEEKQAAKDNLHRKMNPENKPFGMSDAVHQTVNADRVANSLKNGNIEVFREFKDTGAYDKLTLEEKVAVDVAQGQYDAGYREKMLKAYDDEYLEVLKFENSTTENPMVFIQTRMDALHKQLDVMDSRKSGSEHGRATITKGHILEQELFKRYLKAGAKAGVQASRVRSVAEALREDNPLYQQAAMQSIVEATPDKKGDDRPITAKEYSEGATVNMKRTYKRMMGIDQDVDVPIADVIEQMGVNPPMVRRMALNQQGDLGRSDLMQQFVDTGLNNMGAMLDEDGKVGKKGKLLLESIAAVQDNDKTIGAYVSKESDDKYRIVTNGVASGKAWVAIEKELELYAEGDDATFAPSWGKGNVQRQREIVRQWATKASKLRQPPSNASMTQLHSVAKDGIRIHKGDLWAAEKYLQDYINNGTRSYNGIVIPNASTFDDYTYPVPEMLKFLEQTRADGTTGLTDFAAQAGLNQNVGGERQFNTLDQIEGVSIRAHPGQDGFFILNNRTKREIHFNQQNIDELTATMEHVAAVKGAVLEAKAQEELANGIAEQRAAWRRKVEWYQPPTQKPKK